MHAEDEEGLDLKMLNVIRGLTVSDMRRSGHQPEFDGTHLEVLAAEGKVEV